MYPNTHMCQTHTHTHTHRYEHSEDLKTEIDRHAAETLHERGKRADQTFDRVADKRRLLGMTGVTLEGPDGHIMPETNEEKMRVYGMLAGAGPISTAITQRATTAVKPLQEDTVRGTHDTQKSLDRNSAEALTLPEVREMYAHILQGAKRRSEEKQLRMQQGFCDDTMYTTQEHAHGSVQDDASMLYHQRTSSNATDPQHAYYDSAHRSQAYSPDEGAGTSHQRNRSASSPTTQLPGNSTAPFLNQSAPKNSRQNNDQGMPSSLSQDSGSGFSGASLFKTHADAKLEFDFVGVEKSELDVFYFRYESSWLLFCICVCVCVWDM
jgi:hypothetical protein